MLLLDQGLLARWLRAVAALSVQPTFKRDRFKLIVLRVPWPKMRIVPLVVRHSILR
jgi:hypothetical protein